MERDQLRAIIIFGNSPREKKKICRPHFFFCARGGELTFFFNVSAVQLRIRH